ncbi:MAG: Rieske (2Fe-2S) protein [Vampirovibrio sp.]|nr:Rieske (2Fe-2S) protein [Vampirovibrio sp.]
MEDTMKSQQPEESSSGFQISRRRFIKVVLGFFALLWGAVTTFPIFKYLTATSDETAGEEVASVSLGSADAIAKGTGKNFQFGHKPAIIYRDDAGDFHAFSAICTHLGCTVQFSQEKNNIWCACHGGQYDAASGKNIAGPPPKPLAPLNAAVVNGEVFVSRAPAAQSTDTDKVTEEIPG